MAKKGGLGRGLSAILGDTELAYVKEFQNGNKEIVTELEIDKIKPNPYQPRKHFDEEALKELASSIERHGLIQPIIVIERNNEFLLIAGERRLRASKILGVKTIKAIIADITSQNLRELALIENIQRENLNPIELANSYKELIDEYKITQDELGEIIKKSRTQITNTMRLLTLSEFTQEMVANDKISQGHAKILVGLSEENQKLVVNTIIGQKFSVRETEILVKKLKEQGEKKAKKAVNNFENFKVELDKLKNQLKNFGKISIKEKKIIIEFSEISKISDLTSKIS